MPILKNIIFPGYAKNMIYHTVSSVEIIRAQGNYFWRGTYRSYEDADLTKAPLRIGVITNIPFISGSDDPVGDFEEAMTNDPNSEFYGGLLLAAESLANSQQVERNLAWNRVKRGRDAFLNSGVATVHGTFDSDLNSVVNVMGAVSTMEDLETVQWILTDYTVVTLTKEQITVVGKAIADFRTAAYGQGSVLYAQIQAEENLAALRAIDWIPPVI